MYGIHRRPSLRALAAVFAAGIMLAAGQSPTDAADANRRVSLSQWWRDLTRRQITEDAEHANWELAARVRAALHRHPELTGCNFIVVADAGRITLSGPAPSRYLRTKAGETARKVRGVKEVCNEIVIRDVPPEPADAPPRFPPIDQPWPRSPLGKPVPDSGPDEPFRLRQPDPLPLEKSRPAWEAANANPGDLLPPRLIPPYSRPINPTNAPLGTPMHTTPTTPGLNHGSVSSPSPRPPASGVLDQAPAATPFDLTRRTDADYRPPNTSGHIDFNLRRLLASNPQFAGVTAEYAAGVVVLTGRVGRESDLDDLVAAIRAIAGVKAVRHDAVVFPP